MRIFTVADKWTVLRGDKTAEPKYRQELSRLIVETFDRGPYSTATVTSILEFCKAYYVDKFHTICQNEQSYSFYKEIVVLHEQAAELRRAAVYKNYQRALTLPI